MDGDLAGVRAGDGFEAADAGQFAFVRPVMIEETAVDDFDGEVRAGEVAGQPDLAVGTATDAAQDGVIGNGRRGQGLFGSERRPTGGGAHAEPGQRRRGIRVGGNRSREMENRRALDGTLPSWARCGQW